MNILKRFRCDTCQTLIDCRIGMSNRGIQPFQFACPKCEERISFVIGQDDAELTGAEDIAKFDGPFKGDNPFIELHLDFPVYFGEYELGKTTFFRVIGEIGQNEYFHLASRLEALNKILLHKRNLQRLITQYKRNDAVSIKRICEEMPWIQFKSDKQADLIAVAYSATSSLSSPFTIHENNERLSKGLPNYFQYFQHTYPLKTKDFMEEIIENSFLKNLHIDCLSLYPRLLDLVLPLRPAFFYDYVDEKNYGKIPARVSTAEFDTCNSFYKDLAEIFSRQLTLLAGFNNLHKRGDANEFDPGLKTTVKHKIRPELSSLNAFANCDLGAKIPFIDDPFFIINEEAIDNKLRNGIAHYNYEYKEVSQVITYYPSKEGMRREKFYEISFMEFIRKTLLLFREVHSLNHLIKTTLYYCVLILKKPV